LRGLLSIAVPWTTLFLSVVWIVLRGRLWYERDA
jgi:hypothetical protein